MEQVLQALQTLQIERDAALAQLQQAQWLGKIGHWESDAAVGSLVCSEVVRQARRRGAAFDLQLQLLLPSGQLRRLESQAMVLDRAGPRLQGTLQDVSIRHLAQQAT